MTEPLYFIFDVESVGLHGQGFAYGFLVVNRKGAILEEDLKWCSPDFAKGDDDDRAWIQDHVVPALKEDHASMVIGPETLLRIFWSKWRFWANKGAVMVADCQWPVEARFLACCIDENLPASKWDGPYPIHDVATLMLATGKDPLAHYDRRPHELPEHNPLCDARQSTRLWLECLNILGK